MNAQIRSTQLPSSTPFSASRSERGVLETADLFHEARIRAIGHVCNLAMLEGDHESAMRAWDDLKAAIAHRSPAQIARMEERMR